MEGLNLQIVEEVEIGQDQIELLIHDDQLIQSFIDECGYTEEEALQAVANTHEEDLFYW